MVECQKKYLGTYSIKSINDLMRLYLRGNNKIFYTFTFSKIIFKSTKYIME